MILHKNPFFSIYFGDMRDKFIPAAYAAVSNSQKILAHAPFSRLKKMMSLDTLVFLHQIHGINGMIVMSPDQIEALKSFNNDGDFLMTALPGIGLGVATADCLPIIIYDSFNQIVANVHAGWRGTVERVVVIAVEQMISFYGSQLENLRFFFGPSAKVCCYEIKEDMMPHLEKFSYASDVVKKRDDYYTLDVPLLNQLQLEELGIKKEAFHLSYNACTLCNSSFCSYRRLKNSERQMTVVVLTI